MFKYLLLALLCSFSTQAHSEIINYVTPSQQDLGTISDPNVKNITIESDAFSDLDLIASEHGDSHAMGTLANSCLAKQDYECAYKWAGISLRTPYWKQVVAEDKIKNILSFTTRKRSALNILRIVSTSLNNS